MTKFVRKNVLSDDAKKYAPRIVNAMMADDGMECVPASSPEFNKMVALTVKDLAALIRFQEELVFSCVKWK